MLCVISEKLDSFKIEEMIEKIQSTVWRYGVSSDLYLVCSPTILIVWY